MISLKSYSTFHIDVIAKELVDIKSKNDIIKLINSESYNNNNKRLII